MSLRITLCLAIVVAKTPDVQKWMLNLAAGSRSPERWECSHIVEGIYKDNTAVNDIPQKPPSARTVNEQADFHCTGQEYAPL
ncbi:hypothetical protein Anapl_01268 [Anas platyrhynchos]|uniref:Uncharacterized protein n=1 Tax=Anas platyrhynchos TaxID=8839 RepID=R0LKK7_ANAPL|nr:hypothetical protein Anapl_01268 [Anas platyrhynchos]